MEDQKSETSRISVDPGETTAQITPDSVMGLDKSSSDPVANTLTVPELASVRATASVTENTGLRMSSLASSCNLEE